VRNIRRGFQPRVCRDKIGNLIAGEQQILNRWAEYFEELLSSKTTQRMNAEIVYLGPELHISVPTVIEVYDTIRRMKDNSAPGEDAVTAELIKGGGRSLWKNIHQLIESIWQKEEMPEEWRTAIICLCIRRAVT
jgi:hypothetical protein